MAKKRKFDEVPLSEDELRRSFYQARLNVNVLLGSYRSGNYGAVDPISNELWKMFTNGDGCYLRNHYRYLTPNVSFDVNTVSPQHPLTMMEMGSLNGEEYVRYIPASFDLSERENYKSVSFKEWWQQKIFIASAAKPGTPTGRLPVKEEDMVKFSARQSFNREQLLRAYRNKIGSHIDKALPKKMRLLIEEASWGVSVVSSKAHPNGPPEFGEPTVVEPLNTPLQATIAEIATEVCLSIPHPRDDVDLYEKLSFRL